MPINTNDLCGWVPPPVPETQAMMATMPMPVFSDVMGDIKGSGRGKTVLLFQYTRQLNGGKDVAQTQTGPDCVSLGASHASDYTYAAEIAMKGELEEWLGISATEDIYGGSRVNIGKGQLGNGGGSYGVWAAKYVSQYGTLLRKKYDKYDLSKYNYDTAAYWGSPNVGVPRDLLEVAKNNKVRTVSLIRTYEEARDALANGYAITIASSQGFTQTRDKDGFCQPSGSWPHQMCLIAVDDNFSRPGVLILNSWGRYMNGPVRFDQPQESFWCDAQVLEERILSVGDSWAYSDRAGFPMKEIVIDF